jgi:hypothetical protein
MKARGQPQQKIEAWIRVPADPIRHFFACQNLAHARNGGTLDNFDLFDNTPFSPVLFTIFQVSQDYKLFDYFFLRCLWGESLTEREYRLRISR